MNAVPDKSVAVLGAGIVGLCVAHELLKMGWRVELIDPAAPGSQCSSGNAGAISAGSLAPLAMPGVVKNAMAMLRDPDGPMHIPARYWFAAAPWLVRFVAAADPARVSRIADALRELFTDAVEHHQALATEIGCPQRVVRTGQLHLYRDDAALAKDAGSWQLRTARGVRVTTLDAAGIRALEPAVGDRYRTGMFMPDQGAVTEPFLYASAIAEVVRQRRGACIRDRAIGLARGEHGWDIRGEHGRYRARHVVVAAGAWSAALLRPLGWRVPLESQRGYHLHIAEPGISISRPVVLTDRKIFMAPMENGLRIAGTVEFGGLSAPPTERRVAKFGEHAKEGLPDLRVDGKASTWMGHRPCLPDSLPVLGPVPGQDGLWCAFGHGHLGVTGSVNTGRLIAGGLSGEVELQRFKAFSISRFR